MLKPFRSLQGKLSLALLAIVLIPLFILAAVLDRTVKEQTQSDFFAKYDSRGHASRQRGELIF